MKTHTDRAQESKQTTIKLKDDRPHGVKAFLRYLYTFEYEKLYSEVLDWRYHLDVAEVADKYGEPGLEDAAWGAFKKAVNAETEIPVILSILRGLQLQDYRRDCLEEVAEHLRNKHFERLVMEKEFREMMEADMGLMWKYMERLAFAQSLVAIQAFKCKSCGHLMNDGSGKAYTCCGKRMILESFWGKQE